MRASNAYDFQNRACLDADKTKLCDEEGSNQTFAQFFVVDDSQDGLPPQLRKAVGSAGDDESYCLRMGAVRTAATVDQALRDCPQPFRFQVAGFYCIYVPASTRTTLMFYLISYKNSIGSKLAVLFFLIGLLPAAKGQDVITQYKHYTTEQGLSHRSVRSIIQDKKGFIWAGTEAGLNRFDGYRFEHFTKANNGLAQDFITDIVEDANGLIWLFYHGVSDGQIDIFDPVTARAIPFHIYFKDKYPSTFPAKLYGYATDSDGAIYAGSENPAGFVSYHPNKGFHFTRLSISADRFTPVCCDVSNRIWGVLGAKSSTGPTTTAVCNISTGKARKLEFANTFYPSGNPHFTREGTVYLQPINTSGIKTLEEDRLFMPVIMPPIKYYNTMFTYLAPDKRFVAADSIIYDTKEKKVVFNFSTIFNFFRYKFLDIYSWLVDKRGNLWIGTPFGMAVINVQPSLFKKYLYNPDKEDIGIAIRGILPRPDGNIFVNTENAARFRVATFSGRSTPLFATKISDPYYYGWCEDNERSVYFYNNLAHELKQLKPDGTINTFPFRMEQPIWNFFYIRKNLLWAGTSYRGIWAAHLDRSNILDSIPYNRFIELRKSSVLHIARSANGMLWVCSESGFYKAFEQKGIVERYWEGGKGKFHFPSNRFFHFYEDKQGIFWLATADKGLVRWNPATNEISEFGEKAGFPNTTIYAVYEDSHQQLWMPGDKGIIQFDKIKREVTHIFTTADGITNNEFNRLAHARGYDSILYFGGLNGITAFNPRDFYDQKPRSAPPLVILKCSKYDGKKGNFTNIPIFDKAAEEIVLNPTDRFLNMEFALLSFYNTAAIQYVYRFDDKGDWVYQNNPVIQFGGLSYGQHTVKVKALTAEGEWAANEIDLSVMQLAPVYLRPWFIVSALLTLVVAGIAFTKSRTRRFAWQKMQLEKTVEDRTRQLKERTDQLDLSLQQKNVLLKEIHHRVKNNLTIISSLLELQSDNVTDELSRSTLLQGTNRVRSIALIHQRLYQYEDFAAIELHGFADDLYRQIASVMKANNQQIEYTNNISKTKVDIDTAVPLGLIMNELITNSFKYAFRQDAIGKMIIGLEELGNNESLLIYKDNGPGMPAGFDIEKAESLGLRLIHGLTSQLSGKVSFEKEDNFTTFKIRFKNTTGRNLES